MTFRFTATILSLLALGGCASIPDDSSQARSTVSVQILALNDFHGNLEVPASPVYYSDGKQPSRELLGGVAPLGAMLEQLREGREHTITVAAGDLIGASPFISANFLDEPTIMALSLADLAISSVGNHEFDRGIDELRRMQDGGCARFTTRTPCALDRFAGATFEYLAGNVVDEHGESVFPGTALRQFGPIKIGFVGLTLRDTRSLVSSSATSGYRFLDEAETANALARELLAQGADTVVLLIHEGGRVDPTQNVSDCPNLSGPIVGILERLDLSISLVVSGHTHQSYACQITSSDTNRWLTSAGRYGAFITDIAMQFDARSGDLLSIAAANVPVDASAGEQADIGQLVARYAAAAQPLAARVVGIVEPADNVGVSCIDDTAEDLVADAQLAAGRKILAGEVDIALVNASGVRTDLAAAEDGQLTFGEIFTMQPFGNTLEILELSGEDLGDVLEQQFCGDGGTLSACYSFLIPSANFTYEFDPSRPEGHRITRMILNGAPIDPARTYKVLVNNFLAGGGDGFTLLTEKSVIGEAGSDIDALEAYLRNGVQVPVCGRLRRSQG